MNQYTGKELTKEERIVHNKVSQAKYRFKNRIDIRKRMVICTTKRQNEFKAILLKLKSKPCMDCEGLFHPICMDFDHRDRTKKEHSIPYLARSGCVESLLNEIAKCDIVCANCHRLRTYKQMGWTRYDQARV